MMSLYNFIFAWLSVQAKLYADCLTIYAAQCRLKHGINLAFISRGDSERSKVAKSNFRSIKSVRYAVVALGNIILKCSQCLFVCWLRTLRTCLLIIQGRKMKLIGCIIDWDYGWRLMCQRMLVGGEAAPLVRVRCQVARYCPLCT